MASIWKVSTPGGDSNVYFAVACPNRGILCTCNTPFQKLDNDKFGRSAVRASPRWRAGVLAQGAGAGADPRSVRLPGRALDGPPPGPPAGPRLGGPGNSVPFPR